MASDFGNWFYVVSVGLACVKGRKTNGRRAVASVVSVHKRALIFAGDIESPLLLLLAAAAAAAVAAAAAAAAVAMSNRHRCCRCRCCCCCCYRSHMREKPYFPRAP